MKFSRVSRHTRSGKTLISMNSSYANGFGYQDGILQSGALLRGVSPRLKLPNTRSRRDLFARLLATRA